LVDRTYPTLNRFSLLIVHRKRDLTFVPKAASGGAEPVVVGILARGAGADRRADEPGTRPVAAARRATAAVVVAVALGSGYRAESRRTIRRGNRNKSDDRRRSRMTTTITVEGMSCEGCERTIEETLRDVNGVTDATADRAADSASVEGDADVATLVRAVEDAGYTADA
jgi:copper chaperone CopZ